MSSRQDAIEERLTNLEDKLQALQVLKRFNIYIFFFNFFFNLLTKT